MLTITQFTLPQLRAAQQILTTAQKAPAPAEPESPAEAPAAADDEATTPKAEGQAAPAADEPAKAKAAPAAPTPEVLAELVATLPLAENKIPYLLGALKVAGPRLQKLRQVRVVQLEGAPANAVKLEDAAYILDLLPQAGHKGGATGRGDGRDGDRRGGKGGGKGRGNKPGEKRGPRGPGGPGAKGAGAGGDRPQGGRGPGRSGGTPTQRG